MSAETETSGATATAAPAEKPAAAGKEVEEAYNHLMQGKRHLLVRDFPSAVASLADACALLAGKVGDHAPECGEFYLYYGKALLELARAEAGVIEMAPSKSDSDEEEDEDKDSKDDEDKDSKDDDKESKEDKEESESKEDSDEASKSDEDEASKDGEEDKAKAEKNGEEEIVENGNSKTENGAGTSNGAGPSKSTDDGEEVDDDKDEDGEVNNLQLAWEILEMAKIIFQKQVDGDSSAKETKIKLSEALLKLGEVGIESENWPTAIDDLKACLSIQGEVLDKDDRRLAETLYHLAIAHSNNNEYQESIDYYEKACDQLQLRIDALEAKRPEQDMINQTLIDSEVKELKDLLVEMKERLNDTKTEKDEPTPKDEQDDIVKNGSESKPVSNIAHLVRKKPKAESSDGAESKSEVKADTVDKTEGKSNVEERKRKSEDDETESAAALKKAKVVAEA